MFTDNIADKTEPPPKPLTDEERAIYKEAANKMCKLKANPLEPEHSESPEERRQEIAERHAG
jgi:hypothetical protein